MPRQRRTATKRRTFTTAQVEALGDPLVQELFEPWESEQAMYHAYLTRSTALMRSWAFREPPFADEAKAGPGTRPGVTWMLELDLDELEAAGIVTPNPMVGHGPRDGDELVAAQPYVQPRLLTHLGLWLDGERALYEAEGGLARWDHLLRYHECLAANGRHFTMPLEVGRP